MATTSSLSFVQRTLVVLLLASLFVAAGFLSWLAAEVLLTLFAGLLVGVLLRGVTLWTSERTGLSHTWALAVVCVAVAGAGVGVTVFLAASVSQQFSEMYDQIPTALEQLRSRIAANPLGERILGSAPQVDAASEAATQVVGAAAVAVGALGNGVLILFVGLFLAADPGVYRRGLIRLVPTAHRDRATEVFEEVVEVLLRWLAGRILLMVVIGVLTWIGLSLMGVPLALALGLLAGVLSFIPNIGPVISAVPAMLLAATEQPVMALYVGALYLGLQTAESYLLAPYVVRRTSDLPAAAVIGFQLLMGTVVGLMALALATPILAVISVLVERLYVKDTLGDDAESTPARS